MALSVVDFEIGRDDVKYVRLLHDSTEIEATFFAYLIGQVATFSRLDIQGAGPNTVGWAALRVTGAVGDGVIGCRRTPN